jgi:type I restriction enzyme S subunit
VESVEEIPEHWEVKPNKAFLSACKSEVGSTSTEKTLLSLTLKGVIPRDTESGKGKFPADFGTYQDVDKEDLVFCLFDIDETPRTVGMAQEAGMITGAYDVFRCKGGAYPKFVLDYYLHIDSFKGLRPFYTGLRKVVRPPTFMAIKIPLPPLPEQTQIAAFLDRETAKIDELVAEQRRLMDLLKEKRQAVISHAVTRGLNPDAPMKASGVEWLGGVPEHWGVEPFKHQIERNDGGVWGDDPDGISDTIVLRSTEQTSDGRWQIDDPAPRKLTEAEISGSLLVEGDLLLTKSSGSSLHIGKTTLVTAEIAAMRCCYSNFMQRIRMRPSFLPKLAWHFMNNDLARLQFDLLSNSSTGLANLNATMIGQIIVPVPPLPEQTQIAAYLDVETAKFATLTAEAQHAIDLLQERRTALISAAVTGQIDVRELATPKLLETT